MKCSKCGKTALCGTALHRQNEKGAGIKPLWACDECRDPTKSDPALDQIIAVIEQSSNPVH